mgnify:CR=1 FL=1
MLDNLLDELQPIVGDKILEKWAFPGELRLIPVECVNFSRTVAKADYADLVMVSMLQSYLGSDHPYLDMDWSTISAFERLGIDPNFDDAEDEDLDAEMAAAMALLGAG